MLISQPVAKFIWALYILDEQNSDYCKYPLAGDAPCLISEGKFETVAIDVSHQTVSRPRAQPPSFFNVARKNARGGPRMRRHARDPNDTIEVEPI